MKRAFAFVSAASGCASGAFAVLSFSDGNDATGILLLAVAVFLILISAVLSR